MNIQLNKKYLLDEEHIDEPQPPSERKLLAACLDRTIRDLFLPDQQHKREALSYILNKDNNDDFSFNWICLHLELNPDNLRRHILKHRTITKTVDDLTVINIEKWF